MYLLTWQANATVQGQKVQLGDFSQGSDPATVLKPMTDDLAKWLPLGQVADPVKGGPAMNVAVNLLWLPDSQKPSAPPASGGK